MKEEKISGHIRLINDHDESTAYLVTGTDKALLIDTANGREDIHAFVRELTDLPLMVVNTHGHFDHVYGNIYFDRVYIHPRDLAVAEHYFTDPDFVAWCKKLDRRPAEFSAIQEGDVIDLGGISLEIYDTPGHTPGGIVLLDRKERILFTGDTIIEQTWMQMEDACPVPVLLASLDKVQKLRSLFDHILTGHSSHLEDASLCEAQRQAVWEVANGMNAGDESYTWFGGVCMAHPYGREPRRIVYQAEKKNWD